MAFNAKNILAAPWIILILAAGLPVTHVSAAAASPMGYSPNATTTALTSNDSSAIVQWLKITAVPLAVILIGCCLWGLIKNTTVWRNCIGRGGARADEVPPAV